MPILGLLPFNKKSVDDGLKEMYKAISVFEEHLLVHTFLVGERLTLADIFCAGLISRGFQYFFDKEWCKENPNITRWYTTVYHQPIYSAVVGPFNIIDEALKVQPPKKEEKPKQEKAPKPVAAPKPKEKEVEEDEEEEDKPAPKPKHPLESLPKPTLALDDWKRKYSNEETREVALPWFWENYDPKDYSLWKMDYKYNDELTLTFMTSNLIGTYLPPLHLFTLNPPCYSRTKLLTSLSLHRRHLHPSRSKPKIHLRRRVRLWCRQRLHHPRRLRHPRPRRRTRVRRVPRLRELGLHQAGRGQG